MSFNLSDNCIDSILNILGYFLATIQLSICNETFSNIVHNFPRTIHKARLYANLDRDEFRKFIVCPKCCKLYTFEQSSVVRNGKKESKLCDHNAFPNHPQERYRQPCGASLMKTVLSADGRKQSLYPYKTFCYQSLKVALQRLLDRDSIRKALARKIEENADCYYDVYDGRVWREFKDKLGNPYFNDRRNLAGIFNIDWFQPFKNSEYSLGALYLVLLNLPREIRFRKENILLVGLIPGPKEPEHDVNPFLRPLVNELLLFWKGVELYENKDSVLYRFVLVCISSDLPATRKCCGFLSYNAKKGIFVSSS